MILGAGALVPGTLAGLAFVAGLRRIGSSRAAILTFCEPATAVLVGTLAWQERLSPFAGIGAALILAAGLWVSRPTRTLADIEAAVP